jgi:hypothetical protein
VKDGRTAAQPYRVRVGDIWYWVDPTVPQDELELGDTVIIYPEVGDATLGILQNRSDATALIEFVTLEGDSFSLPARDIAALHLAVIDDVQT